MNGAIRAPRCRRFKATRKARGAKRPRDATPGPRPRPDQGHDLGVRGGAPFLAGRRTFLKEEPWEAVVVTNPVIRVTTHFILRIQRSNTVRLFGGEPEAIRWLDERIQEELAAKASRYQATAPARDGESHAL